LVAGEVTFVDGECTGALPGAVLGPAADVATDTGDRRVGAAS
jgi:hypothetical protein